MTKKIAIIKSLAENVTVIVETNLLPFNISECVRKKLNNAFVPQTATGSQKCFIN
ncbi:hypothetical protein NB716_001582 [Pantoea ananatis]|nr:hypothetical protein [Pantoea ananatis]